MNTTPAATTTTARTTHTHSYYYCYYYYYYHHYSYCSHQSCEDCGPSPPGRAAQPSSRRGPRREGAQRRLCIAPYLLAFLPPSFLPPPLLARVSQSVSQSVRQYIEGRSIHTSTPPSSSHPTVSTSPQDDNQPKR
ncbi:hypothetical protein IE53DRAFT_389037 [Violaceomyces palustris]|uniref:Uncharacterized protein n=1 Tax=Violaceomyces palustris TaxID=1673888 RepID=A0ACD0NSJ0_9BASI|nr:hypothetical protein IE53DRAFT_389037 [Violaceomyces palustris]